MQANVTRLAIVVSLLSTLAFVTGKELQSPQTGVVIAAAAAAVALATQHVAPTIVAKSLAPTAGEPWPDIEALVTSCADLVGVARPSLVMTDLAGPHVLATSTIKNDSTIFVSVTAAAKLPADQLRAVITHLLLQVRRGDTWIATTAAATATAMLWPKILARGVAPTDLLRSQRGHVRPLRRATLIVIAPMAAAVLHLGCPRRRHQEADRSCGRFITASQSLPAALRCLDEMGAPSAEGSLPSTLRPLTVHHPAASGGWDLLLSTHPPIEQRLATLRLAEHGRSVARATVSPARPGTRGTWAPRR